MNPLEWLSIDEDYFNLNKFAGEGNIGHMVEQVRTYGMGEKQPESPEYLRVKEIILINEDLLDNMDKIHTTDMGVERIKKNLCLNIDNVVDWCKFKISSSDDIKRKGKNWYVGCDDFTITVNASSFTIITAHKDKKRSTVG